MEELNSRVEARFETRVEALEAALAVMNRERQRAERLARRWRLGAVAAGVAGILCAGSISGSMADVSDTKKPKPPTTAQRLTTLEEAVFGVSPVPAGATSRISVETTRAEGVESTLSSNLSAETSRAEGAEGTLSTELSNLAGAPALSLTGAQVTALGGFASVAPFFSVQNNAEIFVTGANLHIVNGLGATNGEQNNPTDLTNPVVNGLGNLVVGYDEMNTPSEVHTGSHNLIVGGGHTYTSFGGFLAGHGNKVAAPYGSVSGGSGNTANAYGAVVNGGSGGTASGSYATVAGGLSNLASAEYASVCGGQNVTQSNISGWSGGGNSNAGTYHSP